MKKIISLLVFTSLGLHSFAEQQPYPSTDYELNGEVSIHEGTVDGTIESRGVIEAPLARSYSNKFEITQATDCPPSLLTHLQTFNDEYNEGLNVTTYVDHTNEDKTIIAFNVDTMEGIKHVTGCSKISISIDKRD